MVELVFIHIPKTAGQTLKRHIATQYPKTAIVKAGRVNLALKRQSLRDLVNRDTRVIMGHLLYREVEEFLDPQTKVITFLREPVERALSHYYFMAAVEIPKQRKRRPFRLVWRRLNAVRLVSGSQFRGLVSLAHNPLQLLKPPSLTDWLREPDSLNVATRFLLGRPLDKLSFVGFQERFVEDLRRLARTLNWKPIDESLAVNVNADRKRRSEVPQEICQQIWALNEEDIRMYNQAARLWNFRP